MMSSALLKPLKNHLTNVKHAYEWIEEDTFLISSKKYLFLTDSNEHSAFLGGKHDLMHPMGSRSAGQYA